MRLLIVAGMPASGKSTIAKKLSAHFGFPIIEKDEIKEELFDTVGFMNYPEKRRLDVAATAVLMRVADAMLSADTSFIIVNNFRADARDEVKALIDKHNANVAFVFFGGNSDVFYKRYVERDNLGLRHLGHALQEHYPPLEGDALTYEMTREEFREKFEMLGMDKFDIGCDRITVDATYPEKIDVDSLILDIERIFSKNEKI